MYAVAAASHARSWTSASAREQHRHPVRIDLQREIEELDRARGLAERRRAARGLDRRRCRAPRRRRVAIALQALHLVLEVRPQRGPLPGAGEDLGEDAPGLGVPAVELEHALQALLRPGAVADALVVQRGRAPTRRESRRRRPRSAGRAEEVVGGHRPALPIGMDAGDHLVGGGVARIERERQLAAGQRAGGVPAAGVDAPHPLLQSARARGSAPITAICSSASSAALQ